MADVSSSLHHIFRM